MNAYYGGVPQDPIWIAGDRRACAALEQNIDEAATVLHSMGLPVAELDTAHPAINYPEWEKFILGLRMAAVVALQQGESADEWTLRNVRRWGAPNAIRAVVTGIVDNIEERQSALQAAKAIVDVATDPLSRDPRTDIPSLTPCIGVSAWAGITGVDFVLRLQDESARVASSSIDLSVLLSAHERGAHMSRLQQSVTACEAIDFKNPLGAAIWLASEAHGRQSTTLGARATVRTNLKQHRTARFSRASSSITISVTSHAELSVGGSMTGSMAVQVGVMTACPCTLRFSQLKAERMSGLSSAILPPTFTHSQPGLLTLTTSGLLDQLPSWETVVETLDGVAHFREAVLKRQDEHELVERAHRRPQFAEDLARLAIAAVASRVPGNVIIRAEADLAESIHPHRASSSVEARACDIWKE